MQLHLWPLAGVPSPLPRIPFYGTPSTTSTKHNPLFLWHDFVYLVLLKPAKDVFPGQKVGFLLLVAKRGIPITEYACTRYFSSKAACVAATNMLH